MDILTACAYCERTKEEVIEQALAQGAHAEPDEALEYVLTGGTRVLLCIECRSGTPTYTQEEMLFQLYAPIELPGGTTEMEHTCPMKLYDGFSEADSTWTVHFERDGDFMVGHCPECGMSVRSRAAESPEKGEK